MGSRAYLTMLLLAVAGAAPQPSAKAPAIQLVSIQAKLYYPATASFSRDILAEPRFSLWNTIIGEGDAESPSNATIVFVELAGEPGTYGEQATVRLRAVAGERVLVNRATQLSEFGRNGRQTVAFWIYGTGCETIALTATLSTQAEPLRARIPFECGE